MPEITPNLEVKRAGLPRGAYCGVALCLPALYMVVALLLVPSQWAVRHTRNTYQANMGYADRLHGVDCEIVVYGDSSAMVGVDPAVVRAKTGLTACNIAEFESATTVMGTGLLDSYLAHNARPRWILFVFAPEDLTPQTKWTGPSRMDAIVYAMRTRRTPGMVAALALHPTDTFGALEGGLRTLVRDLHKPALSAEARSLRADHQGWFPLPNEVATRCATPVDPGPLDPAWVAGLRAKYATQGTRVGVLVVPEPPCDATYADYAAKVRGVADNSLEIYPLEDYSADGRLHLLGPGVVRFSSEVADFVNQQDHAQAAGKAAR